MRSSVLTRWQAIIRAACWRLDCMLKAADHLLVLFATKRLFRNTFMAQHPISKVFAHWVDDFNKWAKANQAENGIHYVCDHLGGNNISAIKVYCAGKYGWFARCQNPECQMRWKWIAIEKVWREYPDALSASRRASSSRPPPPSEGSFTTRAGKTPSASSSSKLPKDSRPKCKAAPRAPEPSQQGAPREEPPPPAFRKRVRVKRAPDAEMSEAADDPEVETPPEDEDDEEEEWDLPEDVPT